MIQNQMHFSCTFGFQLRILALGLMCQSCTQAIQPPRISLEERQPVEISRAVATFAEFCYKDAPSFAGVERKALSGNYNEAPNGWLEHQKLAVDLVVREHISHKTCQVAFRSDQSEREFLNLMQHPFNATEFSGAEFRSLFSSETSSVPFFEYIEKAFVSRTNFDGIEAVFYGFVLDDRTQLENLTTFGLLLRI